MSKSAEAFRTISEVAEVLDTPTHVLRFWESRFTQLKPVKRAGGRRYYRPADVALLAGIRKLLHDDGLTIRGVQKLLREQGVRHVSALGGHSADDDMAPATEAPVPRSTLPEPEDMLPEVPDHGLPDAPLFAPAPGPTARPAQTAAAEAREGMQRDRDAARDAVRPLAADTHFDIPLEEGAWIPAAALLRAMTSVRASQRREELTAIYRRLSALYDRRRAADDQGGH
ncbi:MAG TPA: MerR family transcriptional regulator [Paracoccaceae bacterium]|nr:MerR family transcriptional regulator [Paracoccaceae bacterium]